MLKSSRINKFMFRFLFQFYFLMCFLSFRVHLKISSGTLRKMEFLINNGPNDP